MSVFQFLQDFDDLYVLSDYFFQVKLWLMRIICYRFYQYSMIFKIIVVNLELDSF